MESSSFSQAKRLAQSDMLLWDFLGPSLKVTLSWSTLPPPRQVSSIFKEQKPFLCAYKGTSLYFN